MEYRRLADTNEEISVLTLGTWVFSGGGTWGDIAEDQCIKTISAAIDSGINIIDTAPFYGFGRSEEIVGKAVKSRRGKVLLATKCGLRMENGKILTDLSPKFIQEEIENSLRRLKTDYIDLYQCHWPDSSTPLEATMKKLTQLQSEGKIRFIGISNFERPLIEEAARSARIVSLQSQYSILDRRVESGPLPACVESTISFLAYGPLAGGILTGKYTSPPNFKKGDARSFFYQYYQGEKFDRVSDLLKDLKKMGHPLNQVALNWVKQQKGVTSILVGCRNAEQVEHNVGAADWNLSSTQLKTIQDAIESLGEME